MKRADMTAAAKFRAVCERCNAKSPKPATSYTTARWMDAHEQEHRREDQLALPQQPLDDPNEGR